MNSKGTLNMTEGSPVRLIIMFSIPMLMGNLFQQIYNVADSIIVGQLIGTNALAAIGVTGSVTFLFFAICNGIGSGGGIVTSQNFGKGDTKMVKLCITNTGYIMILFPIVVGAIAFICTEPLLVFLKTDPVIMDDAVLYMKIMCIGLVFVSVYNYISSILRALGNSVVPLVCLIVSCVLNVFLDLLFVAYFHMGVMGAAVATLISQFLSGVGCIIYAFKVNEYFKLKKEDFKISMITIEKTVKLGIPLSLQFSLIAISCMALQRVVNSYGAIVIAAFTAISRVEQVIHQPYQTLSAALSTYTGQNYGAGKNDRIIEGYRKSLGIMAIITVVMVIVMQLFGRQITGIFIKEQEVIDMGAMALKITSPFYIFLGVIYVIRAVLNGIGDALFALINGGVEVFGRIVFPIMMTMIPSIGFWGIWWSVGLVWFISGFTAWLRYIQMRNKNIQIKKVDPVIENIQS